MGAMKPQRAKSDELREVEALYHAALSVPPEERAAFVEQACAGNEGRRREVESLLDAHDRSEGFLESPAPGMAGELFEGRMSSRIGQQIGRYRIVGAVGAGGMGEVYRAEDPRLDREVAIKILPAHLAGDAGALARFKREAKAVAALSHPNILALHDFDFDGEIHFAVMELLEGETVSTRLLRGPVGWREAVEAGIAVAEGLSAAHKKGIVHRDIKPDNIFLTADGQVKILDFGIARVSAGMHSATQTQATQPGFAVGTVGYMAPEQLRGEAVAASADLFSLGCVLYEMVTGRAAYGRDTAADTAAAILTAEPPAMGDFAPDIPPALENVVRRCLRKQARERFESSQDAAAALRQILHGSTGTAAVRSPSWLRWLPWIAAALAFLTAGALLLRRPSRGPAEFTESLAILPIVNESGDPDLEYVSDGITESLINRMSQFPRLKVMARTTAFRYKGRSTDPQTAGRELNVRRVFTGRMVRQADSMGVQVDLINVADGAEVWGYRYTQKLSDLSALPDQISGSISESLQLKLNGTERKRLGSHQTGNQDAYRLYLLGRYYWNHREKNDAVAKAIGYFQQAIEKDPLYALAYVGMAEAYATLPSFSNVSPGDGALKAKAAARKALEIDGTVSEAYVTLASVAADEWDWPEAERGFRRALELNPGYATAHQWYGGYLANMGRVKDGLAELQRAYELDPLSPNINLGLATLLYDDHQYDRAIEQCRRTLELNPDFGMAHVHAALALLAQGKNKEAISELDRAKALMPGMPPLALTAHAYAKSGNRQPALDMLRRLNDPSYSRPGKAWDLAVLYMGLGDKDGAFKALNLACDERWVLIHLVREDPFFDSLRSDPRFAALLRRMNLTP
jgi:serine/threonine protein kinase/tetratricopeptide (TPR) repeat protein